MGKSKEKIIKFMRLDGAPKSGWTSFLPTLPAICFLLATVAEFIKCIIRRNTFFYDITAINRTAAIAGILGAAAYLAIFRFKGGRIIDVFKNPAVIFFMLFIMWIAISTAVNGIDVNAVYGDTYRCETLMSFIIYPAVYWFISSLTKGERAKSLLIDGFIIISVCLAIPVFLNFIARKFGLTGLRDATKFLGADGCSGLYSNSNHYAYSLLIAVILSGGRFALSENKIRSALCLSAFVFLGAVIAINDTFGGHLAVYAAIAGFIIFLSIKNKKPHVRSFILLGAFIAVTLAVNFDAIIKNFTVLFSDIQNVVGDMQGTVSDEVAGKAGTSRWKLWKNTVYMIAERPFFGFGVEGIGERLEAVAGNDRPHNELLQYAAFFGIPAAIFYLGAAVSVFINFIKRRKEITPCTLAALAAACGYLVSSLFGNTMYYTAPLFFIFLGLGDAYSPPIPAANVQSDKVTEKETASENPTGGEITEEKPAEEKKG